MKKTLIYVTITLVLAIPVCFAQQPSPTPIVINNNPSNVQSSESSISQESDKANILKNTNKAPEYIGSSTIIDEMDSSQILGLNLVARNSKDSPLTQFQLVVFMQKKYVGVNEGYLRQIANLNPQDSVLFKSNTISEEIRLMRDSFEIVKTSFNYVPTLMLAQQFKALITQEQALSLLRSSSISLTNSEGRYIAKPLGIKIMKDFIRKESNKRRLVLEN